MRTNIEIDDELMRAAIAATGARSKREAVEISLRNEVRMGRQRELLKYRGKLKWEGDLEAMRLD